MKKIKKFAKNLFSANRMKMLAMMLLCGTAVTFAQNAAGDYTAGTNALSTVTEEIAKYVPYVVKLCYAIAGVVAVVGAISVYIAKPKHIHRPGGCVLGLIPVLLVIGWRSNWNSNRLL